MSFAHDVSAILDEFGDDASRAVSETAKEVSAEALKKLRASSRSTIGRGKYASGWAKKDTSGRLTTGSVIYGKSPTFRLAHLLEYSHAIRNRYGSYGASAARTHIQPVDAWVESEVPKRLKEKIEGGG